MVSSCTPGTVSTVCAYPILPWNFAIGYQVSSELGARGPAEGPLVLDVVAEEVARVGHRVDGEVRALWHQVRRARRGHGGVGVSATVRHARRVVDGDLRRVRVERGLSRDDDGGTRRSLDQDQCRPDLGESA